jgi:hypothetical protein
MPVILMYINPMFGKRLANSIKMHRTWFIFEPKTEEVLLWVKWQKNGFKTTYQMMNGTTGCNLNNHPIT